MNPRLRQACKDYLALNQGIARIRELILGYAVPSAGAAVAGASAATEQCGSPYLRRTSLAISKTVTMTDATTAGCHGSQKIYDFPAGRFALLGAHADLTFTAGEGGIADNAALVWSLGTAAVGTDNATLTSTEADLIASTAATLVGGTKNSVGANALGATVFDGSSAAKDAYLNLAVPDAGSTADDTLVVSGTIVLLWMLLGTT